MLSLLLWPQIPLKALLANLATAADWSGSLASGDGRQLRGRGASLLSGSGRCKTTWGVFEEVWVEDRSASDRMVDGEDDVEVFGLNRLFAAVS